MTAIHMRRKPARKVVSRCDFASSPTGLTTGLRTRVLIVAVGLAALAGCAVGPNFKKPAAPDGDYTARPAAGAAAADSATSPEQRFTSGADISADWWTLFHSQPLNDLIDLALKNNADLKAARAALSVARENVLAQRGAYFPNVNGSFSATRQRLSGQIAPTLSSNAYIYNLYTPQLNVSFVPDVFGLNRRTMESLRAQEQEVRYQMVATYVTLTANVVVTAIQEASLRRQVETTRQLIDSGTHALDVLRYQLSKGYASGLDVAAQESQLAQFAAMLPPLAKQLAQLRDLLATLTGRFPTQQPDTGIDLATLNLPAEMPLTLPAALVEQRPDVLQAEENLHDASARIGIAIANRLPNLELTGNVGSAAAAMSELFKSGTGFWVIGATATAPIFQGGTLLHQERAAKATYEQAREQYRSTVLQAFQNVADSLAALQTDADGLKAAAAAAAAAKVTLDLAERQWHDGYTGYVAYLSAEQANQQSQIALVQSEAARLADSAALFQALGGGWWHRSDMITGNHEK